MKTDFILDSYISRWNLIAVKLFDAPRGNEWLPDLLSNGDFRKSFSREVSLREIEGDDEEIMHFLDFALHHFGAQIRSAKRNEVTEIEIERLFKKIRLRVVRNL